MKTSRLRWSPFRFRYSRCSMPASMLLTVVFFFTVVMQIVTNTDQAAVAVSMVSVVRVVRVDVPSVVRSFDAKPDPSAGEVPPLLLRCAYALEGGENDDEDGEVQAVHRPDANATAFGDSRVKRSPKKTSVSDATMDAAIEEVQHQRGVVVKWYFRRNPVPAVPNNAVGIINDNAQVYQWIAGGGPQGGGPLGPLIGRAVDVTDETPRTDKSVLHRVIRVDRPTAELTGEYRCQVEDWNAERRSTWYPMVVYTPERIFKVNVDDNDDDDEDDIAEGSGGDGNSTTSSSPAAAASSLTASKKWPTEINITCYAAGMHPEPSMSIWVNGVMLDQVTMVVTDDDGDDDENNDDKNNGTTTAVPVTTTTVKPKMWNRYRSVRDDDVQYKTYAVRANRVVSLKDAEEYRGTAQNKQRRRNTVDVECRLRVPGDGAGNGYWKADRPANRYYGARKSVSYKYRADPPPANDAFAAVSSASSVSEDDGKDDAGEDAGAVAEEGNGGAAVGRSPAFIFVQTTIFACIAFAAARY